jgi:3-hydroxyacyl-CoA dehydrogenase/3-hydroxy-2-methylbutyryl-CoA dehydrogenase
MRKGGIFMNILGKTGIISGGASGLGEATALLLHEKGANVVIADANEEKGRTLADKLGQRALFVKTNIAVEGDVKHLCQETLKTFGTIDLLFNGAGIGGPGRIISKNGIYDLIKFKNIIDVNLIGTFSMICNAAWEMSKNVPEDGERGVIINVASVAAFEGQIGQCAYSASKGGIVSMTLPIARDLSQYGIRVCTIAPGIFDTPMLGKLPGDVRASLNRQVPFPPRMGKPVEVAKLALAIIENQYLNGEIIRIDGAIRMGPK